MTRNRRRGMPSLPSNHLALIVLFAGLGLSGFLAYEAFQAYRMQEAVVERGVQNVGLFIADRAQAVVWGNWSYSALGGFSPVREIDGTTVRGPLPPPTLLDPSALVGGNFRRALAPEGAARIGFDLRDGYPVVIESEASPEVTYELAARIRRVMAASWTEQDDVRNLQVISNVFLLDHVSPAPVAALVAYMRDGDGGIQAVFGFVMDAEVFFNAALDGVLDFDNRWLAGPFRESASTLPLQSASIEATASGRVLGLTWAGTETEEGPDVRRAALPFLFPQDEIRIRVSFDPEFLRSIPFGDTTGEPRFLYGVLLLANLLLVIAALTQLRKEREFVRTRTEFVAGFSHEARNPVATIRLYAQALRFQRVRGAAGTAAALDIIDRESRRLVHMVSNFLTLGASEREALALVPRPMDLTRELVEFAENVRPEVESRRSQIQVHASTPAWVEADRDALHQILWNLVENALKYGPPGQTIRIEATARGSEVLIAVEDGGPGIPANEREEVFEPFVRTHAGIRSGAGGSGLGLSIVRELTHLHGGSVRAESGTTGEGLRIAITLPSLIQGPSGN